MYGAKPGSENAHDRDYGFVVRGLRTGGCFSACTKELKFFSKIVRKANEVFEFVFFELGSGADDFETALAEVATLHDGLIFVDEELAEFVVGAEFEGVFVDDEERFFGVFWVKYITR